LTEDASGIVGKYALVTGAAKGIGRSSALRLAEMGVNVAINYRSSEAEAAALVSELKALGVEAFSVQADVGVLDQVKAMVETIGETFPHIDILVNNAGIIDDTLLVRMGDDAWSKVMETNLNGTFYCTRAYVRGMTQRRWGRIINVGSIVGIRGNPGQANYSASKAGIIGFTKSVAKELAPRGVTANVVTPGYIRTETVEVLGQKFEERMRALIPMGAIGEPDDIGHMVAYVASEKASYMTGQVISVDGGLAV
jgi:3-oxoacyl-[acyl-carrier protein] reductase